MSTNQPQPTDEERLADLDARIETGRTDDAMDEDEFQELLDRRSELQAKINASKPPATAAVTPAATSVPTPAPTPTPAAPETTIERINRQHREKFGEASAGRITAPRAPVKPTEQAGDRVLPKTAETRPKDQKRPGRIA